MKPSEERGGLEPVAEIAYAGIADTRKLQFVAVKETLPDKTKLYALHSGYAVVPIEPTEDQIAEGEMLLRCMIEAKTSLDVQLIYSAMLAAGGKKS